MQNDFKLYIIFLLDNSEHFKQKQEHYTQDQYFDYLGRIRCGSAQEHSPRTALRDHSSVFLGVAGNQTQKGHVQGTYPTHYTIMHTPTFMILICNSFITKVPKTLHNYPCVTSSPSFSPHTHFLVAPVL